VNRLYFGDNLHVLRDRAAFPDGCVDLIYLDPPFNSKRDYNLLFKTPKGHESEAQITAFEDSWHWGHAAAAEFEEIIHCHNTEVSEMMQALRRFIGDNDMMAYLTMMANRLLELHRVLKPTGSLYLHCDPTASHYLKIVLDGVFGKEKFQSEITWQRTATHNDAQKWPSISDVLLFYSKTDEFNWNPQHRPQSDEDVETRYRYTDEHGRRFRLGPMDAPEGGGMSAINKKTGKPNGWYVWKGYQPPEKGWRYSPETMAELDKQGLVHYPTKKDGSPDFEKRCAKKLYLDESKGAVLGNIWTDIPPIQASAQERLGYPTQKPQALLERIISASSNEGDVVLDPFCGCGTAVHAAQKLKRHWIGIDITCLAISLIEDRLKKAFPEASGQTEQERLKYEVHGLPQDLESARNLAARGQDGKYQFQWWAVSLVRAQPFQSKKKGADGGVDGVKFFGDYIVEDKKKGQPGEGAFKTCKIVVSVKGGGLKADDVRALNHVREREGAEIALFISLEAPTRGMVTDAASAGFYPDGAGRKFPRVQLLTIEGLLSGKQRAEHPDHQPDLNFKKAKAESNAAQKDLI
jgi:site-specific DNA-methyltransferase (adenine-specific)